MNLRLLWNCLRGRTCALVVKRDLVEDGLTYSLIGRGAEQIGLGTIYEAIAADRNGHKSHWRRESLAKLFKKLREEVDEMEAAFLNETNERKLEEYGDVKWTATMIADHDYLLGKWEEKPPWTLPE